MKNLTKQKACGVLLAGAFVFGAEASVAEAQQVQRSVPLPPQAPQRMFPVNPRPVLTLENSSLLYRKAEPPRVLQEHDTLTVVVSISTAMQSEGDAEAKKKVTIKAILSDWIKLDLRGPSIRPDGQSQGDPTIAGTYDSQFRAESDLGSKEKLTFKLAVKVVEVLPNGILRIEGAREVLVNEEQWLLHISGEVNRTDIDENKTVTDDKIADLVVKKKERGHVRDGVRRGWLTRFYDRFQPI